MPVIFVHGITVRRERFDDLLLTFRKGVTERSPGRSVAGCYWGDLGSSLHCGGASIPGFLPGKRAIGEAMILGEPLIDSEQLKALLLDDPYLELFALRDGEADAFDPAGAGFAPMPDGVQSRNQILYTKWPLILPALRTAPNVVGSGVALEDLQNIVSIALDYAGRADRLLGVVDLIDPLSRCLTAALYQATVAPLEALDTAFAWTPLEQQVQEILERELGGQRGWIGDQVKNAGLAVATLALRRGLRQRVMKALSLFVGDVLVYFAQRDAILELLERTVAQATRELDGPLWLVGHSLGGILCYDYCCTTGRQVERLVTVGSQVGLFGELGVLKVNSARPGASEIKVNPPANIARWLNIYDPDDMLSFLAGPVFNSVVDVEVDTQAPFPPAHSEYWNRSEVYAKLTEQV